MATCSSCDRSSAAKPQSLLQHKSCSLRLQTLVPPWLPADDRAGVKSKLHLYGSRKPRGCLGVRRFQRLAHLKYSGPMTRTIRGFVHMSYSRKTTTTIRRVDARRFSKTCIEGGRRPCTIGTIFALKVVVGRTQHIYHTISLGRSMERKQRLTAYSTVSGCRPAALLAPAMSLRYWASGMRPRLKNGQSDKDTSI